MTREEAYKTLKENLCAMCAYGSQNMESCDIRGCDNRDAIKALKQESCDNAVSRQAVLKTLDDMDNVLDEDRTIENYKELLKECYEVLPLVNPQPKIGHWIIIDDCERFIAKCSECGRIEDSRMINKYPYCHCGAKMVEPQESEDKG